MKELKVYNLSEEFFDKVLEYYSDYVIKTDYFSKYEYGECLFKDSVIFDGIKKIVITEQSLFKLLSDNEKREERADWIQCICYKKHKQQKEIQDGISGGYAWRVLKAKIKKAGKYTNEQFDEKLNKYKCKYDSDKAQYHFQCCDGLKEETIYKYKNCRKYDINGAYAKALTIIFPEAKDLIIGLYNERKQKPENKELINYFVGMFCVKSYRETYNWIVQCVRQLMEKEIEECDGFLLYANTDGFAISSPRKLIRTSSALGEFKLEYEGDMYIFLGTNYWIIQAGDDITGSCLYQARHLVDLRQGRAVRYKRKKLNQTQIATNIELLENLLEERGY